MPLSEEEARALRGAGPSSCLSPVVGVVNITVPTGTARAQDPILRSLELFPAQSHLFCSEPSCLYRRWAGTVRGNGAALQITLEKEG